MTHSHATGWGSDAPTPAQIKEFFDQVNSGRMTQTRFQMLLGNQPIPDTIHVSGEYQVSVHKGPTAIRRHLEEGYPHQRGYFCVSDENYPQGIYTTTTVLLPRLLYFGRNIGNDEALREFDRLDFEAAPPTAVLALGKHCRHLLYHHIRIVSLAQFYMERYTTRATKKEPLAVAIQLEGGKPEAWASPEEIWKNHDTEVRFAVVAKKKN